MNEDLDVLSGAASSYAIIFIFHSDSSSAAFFTPSSSPFPWRSSFLLPHPSNFVFYFCSFSCLWITLSALFLLYLPFPHVAPFLLPHSSSLKAGMFALPPIGLLPLVRPCPLFAVLRHCCCLCLKRHSIMVAILCWKETQQHSMLKRACACLRHPQRYVPVHGLSSGLHWAPSPAWSPPQLYP